MTKANMKLFPGMLLFAIIWLALHQHVNTQLTMVREFATDDDHQLAQSPATRTTVSAEDNAGGTGNDNIIQRLQGLPTDKLKTLLKIINKQDADSAGAATVVPEEPARLKMETKDRPKLVRLDGNDDIGNRNENSNVVGRKLSFHHRLSRLGNNGEIMDDNGVTHGNMDESESRVIANEANEDSTEIKSAQKTTTTGSLRQLEKVEPVTSVLIHSFEADKDEDKEMSPGLRGTSREENVVKLNANLRHPVRLREENGGGNVDVFAGAEEKSDDNTRNANQIRPNEPGVKLSRLHPKLRRIDTNFDSEQSAEVEKLPVNNENSVELQHHGQENIATEEMNNAPYPTEQAPSHSHNDVTTFVNQVSLSPVRSRQNHEAHYRKVIKEKLPAKIIEEINEAMIERVKESGDKKSSPQSAEPQSQAHSQSDKQGDSTSSQEPIDILTSAGQQNATEMDGNKRVAAASKASKAQFAFSYDPDSPIGPEMWKVLHTDWTCQGRKQSPINIKSENVINDTICKNIIIRTEPEGRPISGILRNNGHAPTLSLTSSASVRLMGGTLPNDYFLKQLHFHFGCENARGSEHKIDGQSYPLELHLVFWDKKTFESFAEAAKSDRGIAVVAVLFQRSFVPVSQVRNTPVTQLLQVLKKIPSEGDFVQISEMFDFRLEKLIPNVMNSVQADRFFTYEGSLTTPGCYESVIWIVYNTHPIITDDQLEMFRKLKSSKVNGDGTMCNNFRPIQKSYGRRIYSNIL